MPRPDKYQMDRIGRHRQLHNFYDGELNLSAKQKIKFKELCDTHFDNKRKIISSIHKNRIALYSEIFSSKPDTVKIEQKIQEIGRNHSELETLTFNHFAELNSVCTPEQQDKFEKIFYDMIEISRASKCRYDEKSNRHIGHKVSKGHKREKKKNRN